MDMRLPRLGLLAPKTRVIDAGDSTARVARSEPRSTLGATMKRMTDAARGVTKVFHRVEKMERAELVDVFVDLLDAFRGQQDKNAPAHSFGVVHAWGIGIGLFRGHFVRYVRGDELNAACLLRGEVKGTFERACASAGVRVFSASTYGEHHELLDPSPRWRCAEAGLGPLTAGVVLGGKSTPSVYGMIGWIGLEASLGPPLMGSVALVQARDKTTETIILSTEEAQRIEEVLKASPDLSHLASMCAILATPVTTLGRRRLPFLRDG